MNLVAHSLLMCVSRSPFQCEGNWIRCLLRHPIPRNRDHHFLKDVQSYPSDLCLSKRLGSPFLVPQYNPAYPCMVVLKAKIERSYKSISFKVPKSSYKMPFGLTMGTERANALQVGLLRIRSSAINA